MKPLVDVFAALLVGYEYNYFSFLLLLKASLQSLTYLLYFILF